MSRLLALCALLALLLTAALPAQVRASGGCASTQYLQEVCLDPAGAVLPGQLPAKSPCANACLPARVILPEQPLRPVVLTEAPVAQWPAGRVVRPDRRPPRA